MSGSPRVERPVDLRLFPLEVVLFPGAELPLRVFESRYRQLVAECVDEGAPFGVVLIAEGESVGDAGVQPRSVGTTARILAQRTDPGGDILLSTVGERRFAIRELHRDRPYLRAEVDYPEEHGRASAEAARAARADYAELIRLRAAIVGGYERDPSLPADDGALADRLAWEGASIAEPRDLQGVLEALDVGERLRRAAPILAGMLEAARELESLVASRRLAGRERFN
ncbi:MAG: peptidase S16 [Chloroflexi bacterium]|nr:peptidase S16 [Chloroflexota bacterium]